MARIFISYSRADALFIEQLVPLLEQVFPDYEIWYDKHLTGGDDWWARILDEISTCDLFIYLLSNESLASDYCQAEFREGLRLQKLALPVIVRPKTNVELAPDDLKAEIKRRNWIDMSGGFKDASANGSLYRAVRLQVAKIPVQPHPPLHPDPVAQPVVIKPPSKGLDPTVVAAIIGAIALVIAAMVGITPTLVGQLRGLANPDTATFTPSSVSTTALAMVPTNPTVNMTLSFTSVPASAAPHLTDTPKPTLTLLPANATSRPMPMVLVTATAPDTPVSAEDSASTLDAQDTQSAFAAQTLTATLFTHTPTATPTPTVDMSSTVNAIRTQRVMGTHAAQQTLIATRWTRTPTPSFTATYTATPTITPTPTLTPIPPTATNVPPTPTFTPSLSTATNATRTPTTTYTRTMLTFTLTSIPPTLTPTFSPTFTSTPIMPTKTPTSSQLLASTVFTLTASSVPLTPVPYPTANTNKSWIPITKTFDDGVEMILVPAGCFLMGSTQAQIDLVHRQYGGTFSNETPQTRICFDRPFWIDKTDVTQEQFKRLDGTTAHIPAFKGDNRPVESITWFESRDFCEKKRGARLPTEAEWEYAARGPESWIYPWGNDLPNSDKAVFGTGETNVVGSRTKGMSWVGGMDMSGNVWQWTSTIYADTFPYPYKKDDGRENSISNSERVIRGSAYGDFHDLLRSATRIGEPPSSEYNFIGFRCART